MTTDQTVVVGVLIVTFGLFVWGRWRYDAVAVSALLALVFAGIVPSGEAFAGFGHPAVVTVAAVLVVSRALQNSGLIEILSQWLSRAGSRTTQQVAANSGTVALLSGFMNNVGALALLLPVTLRVARREKIAPSSLLMPLSFGSLLGGLVTLVGTPPNIVIATFRAETAGEPFRMFDFTPVGLSIAVVGVAFISLGGWRLIPSRTAAGGEAMFEIEHYVTEVTVPEGSPLVNRLIADVERDTEGEMAVAALLRGERRIPAPSVFEPLREGDTLLIETDTDTLQRLIEAGLQPAESREIDSEVFGSDDIMLSEAVVMPGAWIIGRSALTLNLHRRFGVNLLAVARQGGRLSQRLSRIRLRGGDVLLLQGPRATMAATLQALACLPLAERGLRLGQRRQVLLAVVIFGSALIAAAGFGIVAIQVAIVAAAVVMGLAGLITLRETYEAIDWSVIILLGAMIPVGQALEDTGGAGLFADQVVSLGGQFPPWAMVATVLVAAMLLSDVVNNAAAAVLMAPIAIAVAEALEASADPFLMAVAIGASAAFLTPIGHQSNILVMGPGGYRFSDYWRLGLPLEVIITSVAVPMILVVFPL